MTEEEKELAKQQEAIDDLTKDRARVREPARRSTRGSSKYFEQFGKVKQESS